MAIDKHDILATLALIAPPLHQALMNLHHQDTTRKSALVNALSPTERELLRWVAAGRTNKQIAQLRGRSAATVRNQIHSAFRKLGVASRTEALRALLQDG